MRKVYILIFLLLSFYASQGQTATTCSGVSPNYTRPGDPGGTTYTWFAPTGVGFTGGSIQGVGQLSVNQPLVNITNAPVVATYLVNSSFSGAFSLAVTINPTPDVNGILDQVKCNATLTNLVSFSGSVPGTTFNWSNNTPSIGLLASGSGDISAFTVTNALNIPV